MFGDFQSVQNWLMMEPEFVLSLEYQTSRKVGVKKAKVCTVEGRTSSKIFTLK